MVSFRWDVLDSLLGIDIGGYTFLGKYSVNFGAAIGVPLFDTTRLHAAPAVDLALAEQ